MPHVQKITVFWIVALTTLVIIPTILSWFIEFYEIFRLIGYSLFGLFFTIFFFALLIGWSVVSRCPKCGYPFHMRMTTDEKTGIDNFTYADPSTPKFCPSCGLDLTKPYKKDK